MESLTDELEEAALDLMARVDDMGGSVAAIEQGFQKSEIERSAYKIANEIDDGERIFVGVNKFTIEDEEKYEPLRVDPSIEAEQVNGSPCFAPNVTTLKSPSSLMRCAAPPKATTTACIR